jgi:hypothetical protein
MVVGLLAVGWSAGCSKTVVLGSECPTHEGPCDVASDADDQTGSHEVGGAQFDDADVPQGGEDAGVTGHPGPLDAARPRDAAIPPRDATTSRDASVPRDSGPQDAGDADAGLLANPSFELRENPAFGTLQSQFGSDILVSELGGFVPAVGALFADVDPWFACWLGVQVESDLAGRAGGVTATEGQALITAGFGNFVVMPGIFQVLDQPLQVGKSYSFTIDVLNSGSTPATLELGAADLPCAPLAVSTSTPVLTPNATEFVPYCLTIQPTRAFNVFGLTPVGVAQDGGTPAGQVSFDNIVQVASCDAGVADAAVNDATVANDP